MISESQNITLYHASYAVIQTVDLSVCKKRNDFGRGFYLTTDSDQAERFVKTSVIKSGSSLQCGYVNVYQISDFGGLDCYEFTTTNATWLHCVCSYRRSELCQHEVDRWESCDVMIGKIANDNTMSTLAIYLSGGYGKVGSADAVETAVRILKPNRLKNQVCLKTELALSKISFSGAYEVTVQ